MGLTAAELMADLGLDDHGFEGKLGSILDKFGPFGAAGNAAVLGVATAFAALTIAAVHFGDQFEDAYNGIRVGTGATGEALAGLKEDFNAVVKRVPTDFGSASTAIADLNTRLGLTGKPLENLAAQELKLAKITKTDVGQNIRDSTRLFGDWSIKSKDQAGALDELFRASQGSGIGINDLMETVVQFGAPLRNMGFGFEDSIAMLGKWEREGVNTSTVLTGMKYGLKEFAKAGEDPQKALAEIIPKIHDMDDAQKAMSLGMKTFGLRAGPDMVAAIRENRFQYEDFEKAIKNGTDTIGKAEKDTRTWHDSLTLLKNNALVALEPVLSAVVGALSDAAEWLLKVAKSDGARRVFSDIGSAARTAFNAVSDALTWLKDTWDKVWDAIGPYVGPVLTEVGKTLEFYAQQFINTVEVLFEVISAVVSAGLKVWDVIGPYVTAAVQPVVEFLRAFAKVVLDIFSVLMAVLRGDWGDAWNKIKQLVSDALHGIVGVVKSQIEAIGKVLGGIKDLALAAVKGFPSLLADAGSALIHGLVSGVKTNIGLTRDAVGAIKDKALAAVKGAGRWLYSIGQDVINGLVKGIADAWHFVTDKLHSLVSGLSSVAKKALGIASPSKVFAEIGGQIVDGLTLGINSTSKQVSDAVDKVTNLAVKKAKETAKAYQEAIKSRASDIAGGVDLFTALEPEQTDPASLLNSMGNNKAVMQQWTADLDKLRASGLVPKSLLDQITQEGVGAAGQVSAMASMTVDQLRSWAADWQTIQQLSTAEAKDETAKPKGTTVTIGEGAVKVSVVVGDDAKKDDVEKTVEKAVKKAMKELATEIKKK